MSQKYQKKKKKRYSKIAISGFGGYLYVYWNGVSVSGQNYEARSDCLLGFSYEPPWAGFVGADSPKVCTQAS